MAKPDTARTLLLAARRSLKSGLETPGNCEPEHSVEDRKLVARINAYLKKAGNGS